VRALLRASFALIALVVTIAAPSVAATERAAGPRVVVGESVAGEKIRAVRMGDPESERKALVVGSIHGDERAGHAVVAALRRRAERIGDVDLWVVRTVNPDGARRDTRGNARGVDLNRNFPFRWRPSSPSIAEYSGPKPLSEPESRAVARLVDRLEPDVSVWYHQPWGEVLLPCRGRAAIEKRYARIARFPTNRCRGQRLPGTVASWQDHRFGGDAFVVELPGAGVSRAGARRHAHAAAAVAATGAGRKGGR
jgi:murein peptide amidase A